MSTNLQWIGFFGMKKPIHCKFVDLGLFPTDTIWAYFDLWSMIYTMYITYNESSLIWILSFSKKYCCAKNRVPTQLKLINLNKSYWPSPIKNFLLHKRDATVFVVSKGISVFRYFRSFKEVSVPITIILTSKQINGNWKIKKMIKRIKTTT